MSNSVQPHRQKPTRFPRPWDSPGKNTGVGCHFLLQCMKVKSESEVAQSCPTLCDPMDCSLQCLPKASLYYVHLWWLKATGEGGDEGWDGSIESVTQCSWIWATSGRQWTEEPGLLQSTGSQSQTGLSDGTAVVVTSSLYGNWHAELGAVAPRENHRAWNIYPRCPHLPFSIPSASTFASTSGLWCPVASPLFPLSFCLETTWTLLLEV